MRDLLGRLVAQLERIAPYADALYSENRTLSIVKDRSGIETHTDADAGVKLRAFDGQVFHELCVQGWDPQRLQRETHDLIARLRERKVQGKTSTIRPPRDHLVRDYATTPKRDPRNVPTEEKTARITALHDAALAASDTIVNCQVLYREEEEHRVFAGGNRRLASRWTGCTLAITPFVRAEDGTIR